MNTFSFGSLPAIHEDSLRLLGSINGEVFNLNNQSSSTTSSIQTRIVNATNLVRPVDPNGFNTTGCFREYPLQLPSIRVPLSRNEPVFSDRQLSNFPFHTIPSINTPSVRLMSEGHPLSSPEGLAALNAGRLSQGDEDDVVVVREVVNLETLSSRTSSSGISTASSSSIYASSSSSPLRNQHHGRLHTELPEVSITGSLGDATMPIEVRDNSQEENHPERRRFLIEIVREAIDQFQQAHLTMTAAEFIDHYARMMMNKFNLVDDSSIVFKKLLKGMFMDRIGLAEIYPAEFLERNELSFIAIGHFVHFVTGDIDSYQTEEEVSVLSNLTMDQKEKFNGIKSFESLTEEEKNRYTEDLRETSKECQICFKRMRKPQVSNCGHIACHNCWKRTLRRRPKCPYCRKNMRSRFLTDIAELLKRIKLPPKKRVPKPEPQILKKGKSSLSPTPSSTLSDNNIPEPETKKQKVSE